MIDYYVVREKNTGLYFRGKGVNRWGKYYNQASIYRVKPHAENSARWLSMRGEYSEVVPIKIIENPSSEIIEVLHGRWIVRAEFNNGERVIAVCSNCNVQGEVRTDRNEWGIWHIDSPFCPHCGAKMDGDRNA